MQRSIPGKIPWRRVWQPTPVFLPGESMDRGAWQATVHRIAKCQTRLKRLSMHAYMLHIYNGVLLSHKRNEIMPFAATWVDVEIILTI